MSQDARVPSVYRLVVVARAADVAESARTLAAGGAAIASAPSGPAA